MKLTVFAAAVFLLAPAIGLLGQDKESEDQIRKAAEQAKKMGIKMPDMSAINEEMANTAKEEEKSKAAVKAAVESKEPATLPAWMPEVPQFKPAGPATRQLIDGQPKIVLKGTSPVAPEALCDAWDKFQNPKFSHERGGSEINHRQDLYVNFRQNENNEEARLEAERKPGEKVTHVTITSPIQVVTPPEE